MYISVENNVTPTASLIRTVIQYLKLPVCSFGTSPPFECLIYQINLNFGRCINTSLKTAKWRTNRLCIGPSSRPGNIRPFTLSVG